MIKNLMHEKFKRLVKSLVSDELLEESFNNEVTREFYRIIVAFHAMSKTSKKTEKYDRQISYFIEDHSTGLKTLFELKASTIDLEDRYQDFESKEVKE